MAGAGGGLAPLLDATSLYASPAMLRVATEALEGAERGREAAMLKTFSEYGLPNRLLSDNGSPFSSIAIGGLSQFSFPSLEMADIPDDEQNFILCDVVRCNKDFHWIFSVCDMENPFSFSTPVP